MIDRRVFEDKFINFIRLFFKKLKKDNISAIGAQLAYFLIISVFPFIIFFLNILSLLPLVIDDLIPSILLVLPRDVKNILMKLVIETIDSSSETLLSLSALTGLWAASKAAMAFINLMNRAYKVEESRSYIYTRFISIILTIGLLFSFIIALITIVFGELLIERLFYFLGFATQFIKFWTYFSKILSLSLMILIFTILYKIAPSVGKPNKIRLKEAFPGAIFTSIGWILTSFAFSYYVNNFSGFAKTYGSLAGIVVLLIWLYMTSTIILIGGEINASLKILSLDN